MAKPPSQLERALDFAMAEVARVGGPENLPQSVRTVLLVHAAQGAIDNGGLQYFFESDFPGKPPYSVFVDSYRAIGADAQAQALADAVMLFPFAEPHKFQRRRDTFLSRFLDDDGERPDSPFRPYTHALCGNVEVWRLLEQYIKCHAQSFSL